MIIDWDLNLYWKKSRSLRRVKVFSIISNDHFNENEDDPFKNFLYYDPASYQSTKEIFLSFTKNLGILTNLFGPRHFNSSQVSVNQTSILISTQDSDYKKEWPPFLN